MKKVILIYGLFAGIAIIILSIILQMSLGEHSMVTGYVTMIISLLMVFFGLGEVPKILVIAATSFFPMALNAMAGVRQISPVHFDVARSHGASRRQMLRRVVIPGSLPTVLTGVRLATNVALVTTVAVEMIAAQRGLGSQLWLSWQILRVDLLFATLALIALLGVMINRGMRLIARRAAPWLSERELTI